MVRFAIWSTVALGCLLAVGCKGSNTSTAETSQPAAQNSQPAAAAPAEKPDAPFNMSSIFPPGPGRDKVMNTCGSCHSIACTTIGQRTVERWDSIEKSHKDKLTSYSPAEIDSMFKYMKVNFNDKKPEPQVPSELQAQGCTPF